LPPKGRFCGREAALSGRPFAAAAPLTDIDAQFGFAASVADTGAF
jgi:hypothetical protein